MKRSQTITILIITVTALVIVSVGVQASTITWGPAQSVNVSDPTQVATMTAGGRGLTFFDSATMYPADRVVNGITFYGRTTASTLSPIDFAGANILLVPEIVDGSSTFVGATHGGGGAYENMLSYTTQGFNYYRQLQITGLTPGKQYQLQVWTAFWDGGLGFPTMFSPNETHADAHIGTGTVDLSWGANPGGPQFSIGTFTADATGTQGIGWQDAVWGAMLVQSVVPEPSMVMLLSVGGLLLWRRRRQTKA